MDSIWQKDKLTEKDYLHGNVNTDVVIVGGGMAGLLTGYLLKENNIRCAIVEQGKIASGQTGKTTAKITIQHSNIYSKLVKEFSFEVAQKYANANLTALKNYDRIIKLNNIQCHYEKCNAYLYTLNNPRKILLETSTARKLGIDCETTNELNLPFKTSLGLVFKNQAQFNPIEFIEEISKELIIYENTKATGINKNKLYTNKGTIHFNHIVFATHVPFKSFPGLYFAREHQERSYVLALKNAPKLEGIYYGIDDDGVSLRSYEDLLLLGGCSHRTGQNSKDNYTKLRSIAKQFFPDSIEVAHWSAQDLVTPDRIPYIGRFSSLYDNRYVITGFCKWGMTNSMVAAQIITDYIKGNKNNYCDIYSPSRFNRSCMSQLCHEMGKSIKGLSASYLAIPDKTVKEVKKGTAEIVNYKGKKVGVYKNTEGKCYLVSIKCSHLGCQLKWNDDEKTWDCPCHGSRFDYKGNLIDGPAQKGISI